MALAVLIAAAAVVATFGIRQSGVEAATRLVVEEIALNHRKALEPDVLTSDLPSLRSSMIKLDFSPIVKAG